MVAGTVDSATLRRLDDDFRAIHVAGDDVSPLIDQAVGRLRFFYRQRPISGESDLHRYLRVYAARSQGEAVDVAEYLADRFGAHEPELVRLGRQTGHHARYVLSLVDVAKKAAHVFRVLAFDVKAAAVKKLHFRELLGHPQHMRVVIAEGRGKEHR